MLPLVLAVTEGPGEELQLLPDFPELIWGFVAFSILMAFMFWKVFPTLNATLDERGARIQGQIEQAETVRGEAEQLRTQYEAQLADSRAEANRIVEEAKQTAESLRRDIVAKAEDEAAQRLEKARADVDAERDRVLQELRTQVGVMSVALASRIVERELDPATHASLVDEYIQDLASAN